MKRLKTESGFSFGRTVLKTTVFLTTERNASGFVYPANFFVNRWVIDPTDNKTVTMEGFLIANFLTTRRLVRGFIFVFGHIYG